MRSRNPLVLPLNFEVLIDENDPVWILTEICDKLDYTELYETYLRSWEVQAQPSQFVERHSQIMTICIVFIQRICAKIAIIITSMEWVSQEEMQTVTI